MRIFRRFVRRLLLLAARLIPPRSPWERITMKVPVSAFGPGSRRQFAQYFEGASDVHAKSVDEICAWLLTCEYATDSDLFAQRDVWQHPSAFERLRRGDCEDFALWAWRKLNEAGFDAEFFVGRVCPGGDPTGEQHHAWVVFRDKGTSFLFEPAARDRAQMVRPLADVKDDYFPHFAVDRRLRTCAFGAYVLDAAGRRRRRPTRTADTKAQPQVRSVRL